MRNKMVFRPTGLDGLESRIALSTVAAAGVVSAEVAKGVEHHEHTPKVEHHEHHKTGHADHGVHEVHAKK